MYILFFIPTCVLVDVFSSRPGCSKEGDRWDLRVLCHGWRRLFLYTDAAGRVFYEKIDYLSKYLQHLHTLHPDEVEEMINKEVCLLAFVSRVMPFPSPASCSPEGYGESAFTPCWDKRLAGLMITGTALEL